MGYGKTDVGALQNEPENGKKEFPKDPRFLYSDKNETLDMVLCPPYAETLTIPHLQYKVHYNLGRQVICLSSFGEQCPVCDVSYPLLKRGKAGDKQAAALNFQIYPRESYLYNVIPFVAPVPLNPPIQHGSDVVGHVVGFISPAEGVGPAVKIYRCGKKAHAQIRQFLQFNGDIFDPECCNIINLAYVKQASQIGDEDKDFYSPMLGCRPQKCRLHDKFLKMLEKAGTKVEDNCMYDLKAVLLEMKTPKEEAKALVDAKVAEFYAVATNASVAVPAAMPFGGGPKMPVAQAAQPAAIPTPPQTSVVVNAPPTTDAVPTVTTPMVTPQQPKVEAPAKPAGPVDPLAAFEKDM